MFMSEYINIETTVGKMAPPKMAPVVVVIEDPGVNT